MDWGAFIAKDGTLIDGRQEARLIHDVAAAKAWQDRVRAACQRYFREGYVITDFVEGAYLLSLTSAP